MNPDSYIDHGLLMCLCKAFSQFDRHEVVSFEMPNFCILVGWLVEESIWTSLSLSWFLRPFPL